MDTIRDTGWDRGLRTQTSQTPTHTRATRKHLSPAHVGTHGVGWGEPNAFAHVGATGLGSASTLPWALRTCLSYGVPSSGSDEADEAPSSLTPRAGEAQALRSQLCDLEKSC